MPREMEDYSEDITTSSDNSADSLKETFQHLWNAYQDIDNCELCGTDKTHLDNISKCIAGFTILDGRIRAASIFSSNEVLDDVTTDALRFFLVSFYLGQLTLRLVDNRYTNVRRGKAYLLMFNDRCRKYKVPAGNDIDSSMTSTEGMDKRTIKIMLYKAEKRSKERLEELLKLEAASIEYDEERDREKWVLLIQSALRKSASDIEMADQEIVMLEHKESLDAAAGKDYNDQSESMDERSKHFVKEYEEREGITVTRITPDLMITRETIKAGVFQPGWRQPTMTLEEFADMEIAEAMERQRREKEKPGGSAPKRYKQLLEEGLEDDEKLLDIASEKDRSWDNWKDDNPRGAGVTKKY